MSYLKKPWSRTYSNNKIKILTITSPSRRSWESKKSGLTIIAPLCLWCCLVGFFANAFASSITLEWDANPESNIVDYQVNYSTSPEADRQHINVGNSTTAIISDLTEGETYYFSVTAIDANEQQSLPSDVISYSIPLTDTPPSNDSNLNSEMLPAVTMYNHGLDLIPTTVETLLTYSNPPLENSPIIVESMVVNRTEETPSEVQAFTRTPAIIATETMPVVTTKEDISAPWRSTNVGTGQLAGEAYSDAGIFVQTGSGLVGDKSDSFYFTYQILSNNGEIIAHVTHLPASGTVGYAGVMVRDSLAGNAKHVFLAVDYSNNCQLNSRIKSGAKTKSIRAGADSGTWVRLIRIGKKIMAYRSAEGTNWIHIGTTKVTMAANCYIGLAVSSGSKDSQSVARFSNRFIDP